MSQISKVLKKVEESRQIKQESKVNNIVYLADAPKAWPKTLLMVLICIGTVAAIIISISAILLTLGNSDLRQIQMLSLEKTVKTQENQINELISYVNKTKKLSDNQMRILLNRLSKETQDTKTQIKNLISTENDHYFNLKEAVIDNKQGIDFLDKYTKKLNQRIETLSVSNIQTQGLISSSTGN